MKRFICILTTMAVLICSCERNPDEKPEEQTPVEVPARVECPDELFFEPSDVVQSCKFTFSSSAAWTAYTTAEWCHCTTKGGEGSDKEIQLTLTCYANLDCPTERHCELIIRSQDIEKTIAVTQFPVATLSLSQNRIFLTHERQEFSLDVESNVDYTVDLSQVPWITCQGWERTGTLTCVADENNNSGVRKGFITLSDLRRNKKLAEIFVTQLNPDRLRIVAEGREVAGPFFAFDGKVEWFAWWENSNWTSYLDQRNASFEFNDDGEHTLVFSAPGSQGFSISVFGLKEVDLSDYR